MNALLPSPVLSSWFSVNKSNCSFDCSIVLINLWCCLKERNLYYLPKIFKLYSLLNSLKQKLNTGSYTAGSGSIPRGQRSRRAGANPLPCDGTDATEKTHCHFGLQDVLNISQSCSHVLTSLILDLSPGIEPLPLKIRTDHWMCKALGSVPVRVRYLSKWSWLLCQDVGSFLNYWPLQTNLKGSVFLLQHNF